MFFQFSSKVLVFIFFSPSISFTLWSAGTATFTVRQILFFFLLIITRSCCLVEIWCPIWLRKSQRILGTSFSRTDSGFIYHFLGSNLKPFHNSQWIKLVIYSFCNDLLHSLIKWLIVSTLSTQSLYLLFCYILSFLALI